jgi:hypothetical protein
MSARVTREWSSSGEVDRRPCDPRSPMHELHGLSLAEVDELLEWEREALDHEFPVRLFGVTWTRSELWSRLRRVRRELLRSGQ